MTPGTSAASAALSSGRYSSGPLDGGGRPRGARRRRALALPVGAAPWPASASLSLRPPAPPPSSASMLSPAPMFSSAPTSSPAPTLLAAPVSRRLPSASSPRAVPQAIAKAPRIGLSAPVSDSSPANSRPASTPGGNCPLAARMPRAIGRSKRPDSLGRSAGARLTVMRRTGKSKPQFCRAARTRSRLSRTSRSGRPTIENEGRPLARWTSTVTSGARPAAGARERTTASDMGHSWRRPREARAAVRGFR